MSMLLNPYRYGAGGGGGGGDPHWANVALLCGFEGADGSTSFTDESSYARALTANGNAQIDTAQFKFGASSLLLDGTGDYVSAANSAELNPGAGQFTIDAWCRFASGQTANWCIASQWSASGGSESWAFYQNGTAVAFIFYDNGGTLRSVSFSTSISVDTQYLFSVDRDSSGAIRLYKDGGYLAKATLGQTFRTPTTDLRIGSVQGVSVYDMGGHVDEFRYTPGIARYGSDSGFTAPTAAYPRS